MSHVDPSPLFVAPPNPKGHDAIIISYQTPMKRMWSFFRTHLDSLGPRVICAKLVEIDSVSVAEDKNVKSQQRQHRRPLRRTTPKFL